MVKNSCAAPAVALLSLIGGLGILPQAVSLNIDRTPAAARIFVSTPTDRTEVPEAPPPRARA